MGARLIAAASAAAPALFAAALGAATTLDALDACNALPSWTAHSATSTESLAMLRAIGTESFAMLL